MKYIITEDQLDRIKDDILKVPYSVFNNNWNVLQKFLSKRNYPPYILVDDVDLRNSNIESLGSLIEVRGDLYLTDTPIQSLGNLTSVGGRLNLYRTPIESLGNLTSVGGRLNLRYTSIQSLGNLTSVGGDLHLGKTPISKKYSEEEIRQMVDVVGEIYIQT